MENNNMLHTESEKVSLLNNGCNGCFGASRPLKFKRRKVTVVRDFPPGCGTTVTRLSSIMKVKTFQNGNVADGGSESKVVELPCNDMEVEVTPGIESYGIDSNLIPLEDEPNTSELQMVGPVEVQPLNICLPDAKNELNGRNEEVPMVTAPPCGPIGSTSSENPRTKVKETLRFFHAVCKKLLQEEEAKHVKTKKFRVDFAASKIIKSNGKHLNYGKDGIIGTIPGVEVGDEFKFRMELNILGVHRPSQNGIDYTKVGEETLATSIVSSGGYDDSLGDSDVLIYTGQGGNVNKSTKKGTEEREPEDQKLKMGNLALANSKEKKNPIRVIKGNKKNGDEKKGKKKASSSDDRGRIYVYDGLYVVEDYWQAIGSHGKLVYQFRLRRIPGQPDVSQKIIRNSKTKFREGLCILDISEGKERSPISAINNVDDEKPPSFIYMEKMIYPDWCIPPTPQTPCRCTKRCTEARKCVCVTKNGGEIPYNYDGAVVIAKNLIYECGPLCKCPASCYLRVTQHGIRLPLEIFKTESRGWGVRSLGSIPVGTFICEYIGELLEEKEAEKRTGDDEYLFDISNKPIINPLHQEMSILMPGTGASKEIEEEEDVSGFTIDAAKRGNVGRFINHSCSPNLYAQNVLYDHEDKRIPHVMFFAMENIPPLQELSYHYNYKIDHVSDSDGNIKRKNCYCGSSECTGRLY